MSTEMFDTLEAADALTRAGLAEPHARAIAATMRKAVSEGVATRGDIAAVKTELKGDIATVRAKLDAVKAELKGDIAAVKAEILALKWVLGFLFAMNLAMMARLFGVI